MDLSRYVGELDDALSAVAALGDEGSRRAATGLRPVLAPAFRLALMAALADLAAEISAAQDAAVVGLRLAGRDVVAAVAPRPAVDDVAGDDGGTLAPALAAAEVSGDTSRISLRLPEALKAAAEAAAAAAGLSLNAWLVQAVQVALTGRPAQYGGGRRRPIGSIME